MIGRRNGGNARPATPRQRGFVGGRHGAEVRLCRRTRVRSDLGRRGDIAAGSRATPGCVAAGDVHGSSGALRYAAAAFFLLVRSGLAGSLADVARVLASRRALAIGACSVLGGPLFMGGYIAAIILAGPSDALTATATYPVIGAVLARFLLHQQLDRVGWLGVTVAVAGAALVAVDASGPENSVHALVGVGVALAAAAAVAMEGIVATRAMVGLDTNIVMAVQKSLSAIMFGLVLLVVPGGIATVGSVMAVAGLIVPIACAGVIAGTYVVWYRWIREIGVARAMALNISYAMWGAVFAWIVRDAPLTLLAFAGCAVVTAGAVLTILSGRDESTRATSTSADPLPASAAAPEPLST